MFEWFSYVGDDWVEIVRLLRGDPWPAFWEIAALAAGAGCARGLRPPPKLAWGRAMAVAREEMRLHWQDKGAQSLCYNVLVRELFPHPRCLLVKRLTRLGMEEADVTGPLD